MDNLKTSPAKLCLLACVTILSIFPATAITIDDAWINELHYDNDGGDVGEFVEIAGLANINLSGLTLEFYNGSNGTRYKTFALTGILADDTEGYGFLDFSIPGIQNGDPDGLALVFAGSVLQFISYEGSFTASEETAIGMTSTDIGVAEPTSSAVGNSLQFLGSSGKGTWTGPVTASPKAKNAGQILPAIQRKPDLVPDSSSTFATLGLAFYTLLVLKRKTDLTR